jgi:hypothetical protein
MKAKIARVKINSVQRGASAMPANEQVRVEIQSFLQALDSYPDRFTREPEVTFEQHRNSVSKAVKSEYIRV